MEAKKAVFVITNIKNGKKYVGISQDIEVEWFNIKRDIRIGLGIKTMKEDFESLGEDVFEFEIVLRSNNIQALHRKESELAYEYDVWHKGYNTRSLLNYKTMPEEVLAQHKIRFFKLLGQIRDGKYMFADLLEILDISKNDLEVLLKEITEDEMKFFKRRVVLKNTAATFVNYYVDIKTIV